MIKQLVILSLCCIVAQVVNSAPSGPCVELCNSERASTSDGFNSQTAGLSTFQTHAALQNLQQAINNRLHDPQMSLDYTRPGNWSEHNQWATDGGAGKVHEEQGQLEAGNAKVQYYKKNYTVSFGSGNLNNAMNDFINTRNNNAAAATDLLSQQRQVEDFRGSTTRHGTVDIASELESRLHQLQRQMDQFNSNIHEYSLPITTTSSFETHMSQLKTRVDQINNQIHENSQQSRYSNANKSPQTQQHLQQLIQSYESRMQELQNMLNQMTRQANRVSQHSNERIIVPETTNTQQQQQHHHYEYQSHHEQQQQHIKTHNGYIPTFQSYVIPSDNLQQITETQQQQTYVPIDRITSSQSQYQQHGNQNIIRIPIHQGNRYQNYREEIGHELETANDSLQQQQQQQQHNVYNKNAGKHVEEHWSASGHRSESTIPYQHQQQQQVVNDNFERIRQQHQNGESSSSSSSIYQQSGGKFRTGVVDVGQTTADCDTETQSQYKSSPYHQRRYRRGIRDGNLQQTEDLTQQTEDLTQQTEDLTQQTEDLTQQTFDNYNEHGKHREHDHDHVNRHQTHEVQEAEDLSSQRGQLEPGYQRHHESPYDRYGQQNTENHNRHNHNDQDYYNRHNHHQESQQGFDDYTQQQQQQYQNHNHHQQQIQDLTQQSDYSQQINNNQDTQSVVGIEGQGGAKWHTQHNSGDLTNNNYQHQQHEQQHSGINGYGNNQEGTYDVVASTTNKPGFWKGVSNKISKTYEKAKDKVSDVFG